MWQRHMRQHVLLLSMLGCFHWPDNQLSRSAPSTANRGSTNSKKRVRYWMLLDATTATVPIHMLAN